MQVQEDLANNAWGERLTGPQGSSPVDDNFEPLISSRGFTNHEHLDPVGLIHMNGRVYDPKLGRFLSADKFIQDPYNSQSFNRYSYVFNNPLSNTDPTGLITQSGLAAINGFIDWASARGLTQGTRFRGMNFTSGNGDLGIVRLGVVQKGSWRGRKTIADSRLIGSTTEAESRTAGTNDGALRFASTDDAAVWQIYIAAASAEKKEKVTDDLAKESEDGNAQRGFETLDEARSAAYRSLPYGNEVKNEWGAIIYEEGGRYFVGDPIEGTRTGVPFRFGADKNGVAHTLDGKRIVEFSHTHPSGDLADNSKFSRQTRGRLGDVGIAEKYNVNISLRYNNTIRLYDPSKMKPIRDVYGPKNHPGRLICSKDCF